MKRTNFLAIGSILMGTILEWYDFALLGLMAPLISNLFFPSASPEVSLMSTLSVFASGFLVRPIGGIIFGHIGDKYGRIKALSKTIIWMTLPTTLIGLLPTYQSVGLMAPVSLIILRLIQGLASSGEYPGAICYLAEVAPLSKRGLWGSLSMFGVGGGLLLGSLLTYLLSSCLSLDQMSSWGWRIPFLGGLPLGIIGFYLRYNVNESSVFEVAKFKSENIKTPVVEVLKFNLKNLCIIIVLFALGPISFYLGFVYIGTYLVSTHQIALHIVLRNNAISTFVLTLLIPFFGYLSDKVNRKYMLLTGASCLLIFFLPIFILFLSGPDKFLLGQVFLAVFIALFVGPIAAISTEIFSTLTRYSGVSIGLNVGSSVFGGTCPLLATYLVRSSGHNIFPCIYPIFFAFLCLFAICSLPSSQAKVLKEI